MNTVNNENLFENLYPKQGGIPAEFDLPEPVNQTEYLIDGELRQWDGPMQEVTSPVCVETADGCSRVVIGCHPKLTGKESLEALAAASKAYDHGRGAWPTRSVQQRIEALADFAYRMEQKKSEMVRLLMWEIGKSYQDSEKEFDRTITYIEDTLEAMKDLDRVSARFVIQGDIIGQIRRAPLGVVLSMGPFNYPLNETFTTLIPALLMGNTVIFKPPKFGVLLFRPLLEAFREAFPRGVVNTIYGSGAEIVGPLMTSGEVDVAGLHRHQPGGGYHQAAASQTPPPAQHPRPGRQGSGHPAAGCRPRPGRAGMPARQPDFQRAALYGLEDPVRALQHLRGLPGTFFGSCQQFEDRHALGAGSESDPAAGSGQTEIPGRPAAGCARAGRPDRQPERGRHDRDLLLPGGGLPGKCLHALYSEEQFGPIVPVVPFDDIEEPMRYIVESNYGQQVSLFGKDPDALAQLIDPLVNQVCRVNLNSQCQRSPDTFPFTGRKDLAEGTLSVSDALRCFSIRTLVAARADPLNKAIITEITRRNMSNFLTTNFIL